MANDQRRYGAGGQGAGINDQARSVDPIMRWAGATSLPASPRVPDNKNTGCYPAVAAR